MRALFATLWLPALAEARAARTLRICTVVEPGFNELTDAALAKFVEAGTVDATLKGPKVSVGERGLLVEESDLKGYMHEQRKLMFTGKNGMGQVFGAESGNLWRGDNYTLHMYQNYGQLLYYTRVGFCQIGWAPFTVKPSRETCSAKNCPDVAAAKNTAWLKPEVTLPVVALAQVESSMSCCIDFPQTTCSTGLAVAFRKFVLHHWYEKARVHNIAIQMLLAILVSAHAVWFFERLNNRHFPRRYLAGIDDAMWFSAVTVTTVGYGDKCPKSTGGRLTTMAWMLMGIVISSLFTAVITSEVSSTNQANDVRTLADFAGKVLCTTGGYWHADPLIAKNRAYFGAEVQGSSLADCIERMIAGTVDAVYYDRPPMEKMLVDRRVTSTMAMTPDVSPLQLTPVFPDAFNPRFGKPAVLELRNEYNEQVLALSVNGALEKLYEHHFAAQGVGMGVGTVEETLDVGGLMVLLGFTAAYIVLNVIAREVNRGHKHHQTGEKPASRLSFIAKYFDCAGFFAWEEERHDDSDHTVDTKLDNLTKQLAALTEVVAKIPGVPAEVLQTEVAAVPEERGPAGRSQRVKVAPLQLRPTAARVAPPAALGPLEALPAAVGRPVN